MNIKAELPEIFIFKVSQKSTGKDPDIFFKVRIEKIPNPTTTKQLNINFKRKLIGQVIKYYE